MMPTRMLDEEVLRSSITTQLLRHTLLRGTLLAAAGGILLLAASFLSPIQLKPWGIIVAILFLLLVAYGLLPYRRLTRLQLHPHQLRLRNTKILYCRAGEPLLELPTISVQSAEWISSTTKYGIAIHLKESLPERISLLQENFDIEKFCCTSRRLSGGDLFFPYFSYRTFLKMENYLEYSD